MAYPIRCRSHCIARCFVILEATAHDFDWPKIPKNIAYPSRTGHRSCVAYTFMRDRSLLQTTMAVKQKGLVPHDTENNYAQDAWLYHPLSSVGRAISSITASFNQVRL